jgi:hypothetical protein
MKSDIKAVSLPATEKNSRLITKKTAIINPAADRMV